MSAKYSNYHKNPRTITEEQQTQLKKWIVEFGDLSGIVINISTGEKICGNQRGDAININDCEIEIAKRYDTPDSVGTVAEGFVLFEGTRLNYREVEWDDRRAEQANIIANKAGGNWDWQILTEDFEINDLLEWGFSEEDFAGKDVEVEPEETKGDDDVPEVQEQAETVRGDLWELGEHRLLCGDSTMVDDVGKLMNGSKANIVFTDPPYDLEDEDYVDTIPCFVKDAHVFVMHDDKGIVEYLRRSKLDFQRFFVANFGFCSPRGNDPYLRHILVSHEKYGDAMPHKNMHDGLSSIIQMKYRGTLKDDETSHKHQKSIDFIGNFLNHYSNESGLVLDLFMGSGSTLITAEKEKRVCYGMELSENFCDLVVKRYVKFCRENGTTKEIKLNGKDYLGALLD